MTAISATVPAPARRVSPLGGMRNTFTLTWRSVLKIRTNTEDVIGLSLQPIMFLLLFTYVFGGAIAHGSTHDYLQYELPGLLVMTVVFATLGTGLMLNQDITSGVFDRFRSLPIARWAPLAGAVLGDMVRYLISVAITIGFGMILWFPGDDQHALRPGRLPAAARLRTGPVLGLGPHRHAGEDPAGGAGLRVHRVLPARVRQQPARSDRHHAGLAAGVRQGQPDDPAD
jgi:ABC-2 type transporter